jgi:signal transduction histidine kinase
MSRVVLRNDPANRLGGLPSVVVEGRAGLWRRAVEVDLALVLLGLGLLIDRAFVGVWVPRDIAGSLWWALPVLALPALSLAVRRAWPLVTVTAATSAPAVHGAIVGRAEEGAFLLIPVCVAVYSLGAYAGVRTIVVGLAVAVAAETADTALDPGALATGAERWSWAFWLCVQVVIAVIGVFVAARRREHVARRAASEVAAHAAEEARAAVADERARIARELHDVITHNLNVMVLHASAAAGVVEQAPDRARASLQAIEATGRGALVEMRRLLGVLRDHDLAGAPRAPQPRLAALDDLVAQARAAHVDVTIDVDADDLLTDGVELAAYRIVQESLSNAIRHAPGSSVRVAVRQADGHLHVDVVNSNPSAVADPAPSSGGHGLIGMRERVSVFGGSLHTGPRPDGGFAVHATIPVGDPP